MKTLFILISLLLIESSYAQNLLTNGDAELGDLTGWNTNTNVINVVTEAIQTTGTVTPQEGSNFFSFTGEQGEQGTLSQQNNLTDPLESLQLTGYFHGEFLSGPGNDDYGEVILSIYDINDILINTISTGELQPNDPKDWQFFSLALPLESNSSSWKLELKGTKRIGGFINVFYDNLILLNSEILETAQFIVQEKMKLFPNPLALDVLKISNKITTLKKLNIFSTNGLRIKEIILNENFEINLSYLRAGVYFILGYNENNQIILNEKLIKL